jgi:hypothetical protein
MKYLMFGVLALSGCASRQCKCSCECKPVTCPATQNIGTHPNIRWKDNIPTYQINSIDCCNTVKVGL